MSHDRFDVINNSLKTKRKIGTMTSCFSRSILYCRRRQYYFKRVLRCVQRCFDVVLYYYGRLHVLKQKEKCIAAGRSVYNIQQLNDVQLHRCSFSYKSRFPIKSALQNNHCVCRRTFFETS